MPIANEPAASITESYAPEPAAHRNGPPAQGKIQALKSLSSQMFRSLRHRNYRLFFAGQLVSLCGTWMQNVAQSWLVWQLSHSAFWLGVVGFMTFMPQLLFPVLHGTVTDRFPKRLTIIVTQTISMLLAFILAALVWTDTVTGGLGVRHGVLSRHGQFVRHACTAGICCRYGGQG